MSNKINSKKDISKNKSAEKNDLKRMIKYVSFRIAILFITVLVGVYLVILIANMGGHVDNIRESQIKENVGAQLQAQRDMLRDMDSESRREYENELVEREKRRLGLDQPFMLRSVVYLKDAITLDLGRAEQMTSDSGSRQVRVIILERLPPTLMLMVSAYLITFFVALFLALFLSRRYGSKLDRAIVTLAPTSAAPGWFYGIFLILIFSTVLGLLPSGRMVDAPPPENIIPYALSVLRHLILPVIAQVIAALFITIYNWRTFFLIYSREDYVEMAKAKGLSRRAIELKYILRPTLPPIITSFAMALLYQWMGAIILETVFNWPGLGRMLYKAIGLYDVPVIVGAQVIFAYLLAVTVFLLDIIYAILDPRVKVGKSAQGGKV
ncbi:MAG: ABC transporter permease [Halanaerobiaceae bacterium]